MLVLKDFLLSFTVLRNGESPSLFTIEQQMRLNCAMAGRLWHQYEHDKNISTGITFFVHSQWERLLCLD